MTLERNELLMKCRYELIGHTLYGQTTPEDMLKSPLARPVIKLL